MVKTYNKPIEKVIEKAKKDRKKLLYSQIDFWLNAKEHTEGYRAYMIEKLVSDFMEEEKN